MRAMSPLSPTVKKRRLAATGECERAGGKLATRVKRPISASQASDSGTNLNTKLDITRLSGHQGSSGPMEVGPAAAVSSVATVQTRPVVMRPAKINRDKALSAEVEPEKTLLSHRDP